MLPGCGKNRLPINILIKDINPVIETLEWFVPTICARLSGVSKAVFGPLKSIQSLIGVNELGLLYQYSLWRNQY